jgi:hypothetical protein
MRNASVRGPRDGQVTGSKRLRLSNDQVDAALVAWYTTSAATSGRQLRWLEHARCAH